MPGAETPVVLLRASDRLSRSRIWSAVHGHVPQREETDAEAAADQAPKEPIVIRLGERGTPVAQPRRRR